MLLTHNSTVRVLKQIAQCHKSELEHPINHEFLLDRVLIPPVKTFTFYSNSLDIVTSLHRYYELPNILSTTAIYFTNTQFQKFS